MAVASKERTDGSSAEHCEDQDWCLSSRQGSHAASLHQTRKEMVISGHCLAQRHWGAKQREERDMASTPSTFTLTQLCQPCLSAHLSQCWLLPRPQDLGRWLHMLNYLSSQVVGTRPISYLTRQSPNTSSDRGAGDNPRGTPQATWLPGLRERQGSSTASPLKSLQQAHGEEPWKISLINCYLSLPKSKLPL